MTRQIRSWRSGYGKRRWVRFWSRCAPLTCGWFIVRFSGHGTGKGWSVQKRERKTLRLGGGTHACCEPSYLSSGGSCCELRFVCALRELCVASMRGVLVCLLAHCVKYLDTPDTRGSTLLVVDLVASHLRDGAVAVLHVQSYHACWQRSDMTKVEPYCSAYYTFFVSVSMEVYQIIRVGLFERFPSIQHRLPRR